MKILKGFTLAEVLITLTVIGIVAAISLPALNQNVNERAWSAKRKALHSRLSAAILSMPQIKGFGEYSSVKNPDTNEIEITDTMAESFLVEGLSKSYKIKNICDVNHLDKCGLPETFITLQDTRVAFPKTMQELYNSADLKNTAPAAFETENGEKIAVYYNPNCTTFRYEKDSFKLFQPICLNFIYDLNGQDDPNKIGKDMGIISAVYGPEGLEVVAPNPASTLAWGASYSTGTNAAAACKNKSKNLTLASISELSVVTFNSYITGLSGTQKNGYISGSIAGVGQNGKVWGINNGMILLNPRTTAAYAVCVQE